MSIADYVLTHYRDELIAGKQIAYEGHVFMTVDDWDISDGRHVYVVSDTMSMKQYNIYSVS